MRKILFLNFCIILFSSFSVDGLLVKGKRYKATQIRATLNCASIGMPTHMSNGRFQLGAELGFLHPLKKNNKKWNYSVHAGYFAFQSLQRATYIKPGIGYSFKFLNIYMLRPSFNAAMMGVWQTNDEFKFIGNGQYEKVKRFRTQAMPTIGLELLMPIPLMRSHKFFLKKKEIKYSHSVILRYEFGEQTPFSKLSNILPINQLHIGVNTQF